MVQSVYQLRTGTTADRVEDRIQPGFQVQKCGSHLSWSVIHYSEGVQ